MKKVYIVCIAVACLLIVQVFRLFYSIPDRDVLLGSSFSPSGDYIVYFYRNDGKGATVRSSIIADVYSERTGKTRNIFYRYGESEVDSGWHDDKNITINGCMIDAENGEYISKRHSDYRSLDPVRTVYSQDERYCIYIYEVYVGFGNSKSSRYFIDAVDRMTQDVWNVVKDDIIADIYSIYVDGDDIFVDNKGISVKEHGDTF